MTENKNVFWNSGDNSFEFTDKSGTDIEFFVFESNFGEKEKFVSIHVDEHSRGWDQSGFAKINIPADKWKEFVEAINKLKV